MLAQNVSTPSFRVNLDSGNPRINNSRPMEVVKYMATLTWRAHQPARYLDWSATQRHPERVIPSHLMPRDCQTFFSATLHFQASWMQAVCARKLHLSSTVIQQRLLLLVLNDSHISAFRKTTTLPLPQKGQPTPTQIPNLRTFRQTKPLNRLSANLSLSTEIHAQVIRPSEVPQGL